ncbi:hypothetical protein [Sciscionella sediminilitoris]|uniref:hypothetical protein n=1 Tax=Sciscionella sediminilitoris TaxID=1445613 RepID=UPI0004DF54A1|nr:hypothetical protein [Sciscionella sp. SE31]
MKARILCCAAVTVAVIGTVSGCSNPTGKSWAISYEVTAPNGGTLSAVSYSASADRYQDEVSDRKVTGPVGLPWKEPNAIVSAGKDAKLTATPTGQALLSCRILLDGTKELAKATAPAPGKPVTCRHRTDS